jgi:PAS domain S-box-containing protein
MPKTAFEMRRAQPVRILVVDDRPENLVALGTILEGPDRLLVAVRSGREALRELLRQEFALILLDVNMPDMTGFETADLIRKRPASAHTPIIFLTAQHDEGLAARSYQMGAVDYISTPVNGNILRAKAAVFVELFKKTEENRRQAERLRRVEARLRRRAEERLREADERLRLVVESVIDYAIFSLDEGGRIATWNAGAVRLFGFTEREAVGSDCAILFPEEARGEPRHWLRARAEGRTEVDAWFERKGGARFFGRGVVTAMRGPDGEIQGYSKVVHDATERKQAEEALARQAEQLQEANRLKDEFLAVLSHELRTPLNAIIGWTQMLRRDRLDAATARQALDAIARNGEAQLGLINDILDVSRFVAGKTRLNLGAVDVRAAVRAAVDTGAVAAGAKGVELRVDLGEEALVVNGDADRLQQVVWNLVSNAVKFTPTGGHVVVAARRTAGDKVLVSVADDGAGIPASFVPHVFERFRQADSSSIRAHGGLGLGLAIVRHLIELHGGIVHVESEGEGRGARFEVELPAFAGQPVRVSQRHLAPPPPGVGLSEAAEMPNYAPLPGVTCLVVDDDRDAREVLKTVLERQGLTVQVAASAASALDLVAGAQVLLADIGMPDQDGYSLIRRIRQLPGDAGGRVPAIAITAYAGEGDRERALVAGFDRHLTKPVRHHELLRAIRDLVRPALAGSDTAEPKL